MSENNVIPISGLPEKKKWYRRRAFLLGTAIACVLLLLGLYLFFTRADLDGFQRFFRYYSVSDDESYGKFEFEAGYANAYCAFDDGLAIAGTGGLTTYSPYGNEQAVAQLSMDTPAAKAGSSLVLAYDVGGSSILAISDKDKTVLSLSTADVIFDADIGSNDCICYLTADSASRAVLTVLNARQEEIYKWYSNSQHLSRCAISDNGSYVAAIGIGQTNGAFSSSLLVLDTGSEEPLCSVALGSQVIYELAFTDNRTICAVGENKLISLGIDGTIHGEYAYGDQYMEDFVISDSFTAFLMNSSRAGDKYSLVTVGSGGKQLGEVYLGKQILDMDAAGEYLAVLASDSLTIYTKDLEVYRTFESVGTASSVCMRADGTAILVSNNSATLYIP